MPSQLVNHLWQSTVFALIAWLLTIALRKNQARTRHRIWLAASVKFLVPFSLLVSAGSHLQSPRTPQVPRQMSVAVQKMNQPFTFAPSAMGTAARAPKTASPLPFVWASGITAVLLFWIVRWRRIRSIVRNAYPLDLGAPIRTLSSPAQMEPGVFGIFRPVLLLPAGIEQRLTRSQFQAIIAHEMCHVRRRDNLAAAIHMLVEAIFWFHPLVWWLGARLVAERERACDEEVLLQGTEPEAYAEGILSVCRLYLEAPLACVSGVTGSDLKKRIEAIMKNSIRAGLSMQKKTLLAAAAILAVTSPLVIGVIHAQAPAFDVASIKPNTSRDPRAVAWQSAPGGALTIRNVPLRIIINQAYELPMFNASQRLVGAPKWIDEERFDIEAKAPRGVVPAGLSEKDRNDRMMLMLRTLLADRFKLATHQETKELPLYSLTISKNGLKLQPPKTNPKDCPEVSTRDNYCHTFTGGQGQGVHGRTVSMPELAVFLESWTDRPVINNTGFNDLFDIDTPGWIPMRPRPGPPPGQEPSDEDRAFADPARPTLGAVLDKVGLKLEPSRGPVEIIVIDHIERPSAN